MDMFLLWWLTLRCLRIHGFDPWARWIPLITSLSAALLLFGFSKHLNNHHILMKYLPGWALTVLAFLRGPINLPRIGSGAVRRLARSSLFLIRASLRSWYHLHHIIAIFKQSFSFDCFLILFYLTKSNIFPAILRPIVQFRFLWLKQQLEIPASTLLMAFFRRRGIRQQYLWLHATASFFLTC